MDMVSIQSPGFGFWCSIFGQAGQFILNVMAAPRHCGAEPREQAATHDTSTRVLIQ
jgi:hypothetical protein